MEGLVASDGGRFVKTGLLEFGALIWAAPVVAQTDDPLAPLAVQLPASPPVAATPAVSSMAAQPAPPVGQAVPPVAVPKDWRGVFDAIDAGNWAAARAGISALP